MLGGYVRATAVALTSATEVTCYLTQLLTGGTDQSTLVQPVVGYDPDVNLLTALETRVCVVPNL